MDSDIQKEPVFSCIILNPLQSAPEVCVCVCDHVCVKQGPANQRDKDVTKTTSDLSEDLFKVHDFDVKIDLQVPSAGECPPA